MKKGNNSGIAGTSRMRGDPWRAYDRLPPDLRRALQLGVLDWCPLQTAKLYKSRIQRGMDPSMAEVLEVGAIRKADDAEIMAVSQMWSEHYGTPSPHVAADATVQGYYGDAPRNHGNGR